MSELSKADLLVADWAERDRVVAWIPDDRRALEQAAPLRQLVIELFVAAANSGVPAKDLYHACSRFGSELGARGASPTFAGGALDGARAALDYAGHRLSDEIWRAAHAALLEGYVRVIREQVERTSFASWEPAHCVVLLEGGAATVAAGHPSTEPDVLASWAGRVAGALMVRGVRRAQVAGEGLALSAVLDALTDAGIAAAAAPPAIAPTRR